MPIVFVHGVNNRRGPSYDAGVRVKTAFLKKHMKGATIGGKTFEEVGDPVFPYWGDLGTSFAWDMASLPSDEMQALGGLDDAQLQVILATVHDALPGGLTEEPLVALAQHDFQQAVEVLAALALENAPEDLVEDVAAFVVDSQEFAEANPNPPWLANVQSDQQLIGNLKLAIEQENAAPGKIQSQGLGDAVDAVKTAASKLKSAVTGLGQKVLDKTGDFASTKLLGRSRKSLNANLGRFFGDVFHYFDGRGDSSAPGPIPQRVMAGLDSAIAAAPQSEPLVIIGHSLGGVITFDLLGHFRPDLEVDLFVSVGSQVAHFEEIKLFKTSDDTIQAPAKALTPPTVKRWINIYDEVDIFSYTCDRVFDRVDVDGRYDTKTYVIKSHSEYFKQKRLYKLLRARIDDLP